MQTLAQTLYTYAQEHRVMDHLQLREYHRLTSGLEEGWEAFCGSLSPTQKRQLASLLARQSDAEGLEDRASFLAGVSMGLELARL